MSQKKIVVSVAGGHGLQPFRYAMVNNPMNARWVLIFNTFDSGSHSGHLRDLFQDTGPMGDLRNNIGIWLTTRAEENDLDVARLFQDRPITADGTTYQERLHEDIRLLEAALLSQASPEVVQVITDACHKFVDEYAQRHEQSEDTEVKRSVDRKGHSFGNIILTALTRELGREQMIAILKEVDIIPEHIDIKFMSEERLHVEGTDALGQEYRSEDAIDHAEVEIDPRTLRLVHDNERRTPFTDIPQDIVDEVAEADLFIIPTGSQANSFPFTVMLLDECRRQHKDVPQILRFSNLTVRPQEVSYFNESVYLDEKGHFPIYLVCDGFHVSPRLRSYQDPAQIVRAYRDREHKQLQIVHHNDVLIHQFGTAIIPGIKAELYPVTDLANVLNGDSPMTIECGIRHQQEQVAAVISRALSFDTQDSRDTIIRAIHSELKDSQTIDLEKEE